MRRFGIFLLVISIISSAVTYELGKSSTVHADTGSYTCQPNGTFASITSGPAALTASDVTRIGRANDWLASMLQPDVTIVTNSTITPDQSYTDSYTGATSGSFTISGRTYTTTPTSSIVVTSPASVADSYRGVISGHVTMAPQANRWIIQAYKNNGGIITQVPRQALADGTTGDFSIDLTTVDGSYTGQWMLGILDANAGYAEYGTKWPAPDVYNNLAVQELVVTDTTYLWASTAATTDGRFSFANSQVGAKMFRLVDTSSNEILAQSFNPTGLIRSYEYEPGETGYGTGIQDLTYVYDQALALYTSVSQGQTSQAKLLVDGLLKMQTTTGTHTGGFVFSAPQLSPEYHDQYYRTGASALAVDALLSYIEAYPNDPDAATYKLAALSGLDFIDGLYSSTGATAGLYLGGYGNYSGSPQTFDPNYVVTFASTEHNLDIWHVFTDAAAVFGNDTTNYSQKAASLDAAMASRLYSPSLGRFNQGINGGLNDTSDALDIISWGAIQLVATNKTALAQQSLTHLPSFQSTVNGTTGYAPFYDSAGYPGAVNNVWYEGSFGVALALYDTGDYTSYRTLIDQLSSAQLADGSFRYAEASDANYGIGVSRSVASTAWFILATAGRSTIWSSCAYSPSTTPSTPADQAPAPSTTSKRTPNASNIRASDLSMNTSPQAFNSPTPTTPSSGNSTSNSDATQQQKYTPRSSSPVPVILVTIGGLAIVGIALFLIIRRRLSDN